MKPAFKDLLIDIILLFLVTTIALGKIRSSAALFLLVALMGVVQASKLHYRYENFKFADLATAREGAKMVANQFSPVLPPYFVPSVVLMVLIVAFLIWLKRPRLHLSYRLAGAPGN